MSLLEQSSEQIPQVAPSKLDAIVALSPDLWDQINRYNKQILQLSDEQQRDLIERWKIEVQSGNANIGVFSSIVRNIRIQWISTEKVAVGAEKVAVETKEVAVETKEVAKEKEKKENKIRYDDAIAASQTANEIGSRIWGKYAIEIEKKSNEDLQKPETQQYLATLGIKDIENIPSEKKQVIQDILTARATTQVLLDNQRQILADNPEFWKDIQNLSSLRFTLGLSDKTEAKNIGNLLIDQPKSDRETITSAVNSLTKWAPDTLVTRTGDRLTFSDPRNERYSYEIDMSKQPPRLAKTRNGLSISRDVVGLSPEQREQQSKYEVAKWKLDKWEREYSQWINEFWGARRDEYSLIGTNMEQWEPGKEAKKEINIYSSIFLTENRAKQTQYEMIEQELANGNIRSEDRANKFDTMKQLTADMKSTNLSQMLVTWETENHSKINTMLEQRYEKINRLQKSNQEIVEAKTEVSKNPQNTENQYDTFDATARDNLSWLVDNRFDRMWPRANDAIGQIIASINKDDPSTAIDLTEPMRQRDHERLITALERLWGTNDVLTSGDKLPPFQNKIMIALSKNTDNPVSIEGLLRKTETPTPSLI